MPQRRRAIEVTRTLTHPFGSMRAMRSAIGSDQAEHAP